MKVMHYHAGVRAFSASWCGRRTPNITFDQNAVTCKICLKMIACSHPGFTTEVYYLYG